ncbi:MAG: hypothetical protein A2Y08_03895 [Planctomycetes bacterium GWA2_40_7]|nr:MAG: hypothetical protein A2Y08_03895 [Planctomycetes bacterium GWA2_40_7]
MLCVQTNNHLHEKEFIMKTKYIKLVPFAILSCVLASAYAQKPAAKPSAGVPTSQSSTQALAGKPTEGEK